MNGFDQRATTLDLNGPTLSWLTQPTGVTTCGVGTFIGIATATFPVGLPASYATNTGSLSYQWWYEQSQRDAPIQGKLTNGTMSGLGLTGITGAATTTLTVYGNSTTFELGGTTETVDGLRFFLKPDYVPSAYGTSDPITAGTARSTGNAVNEGVVDDSSLTYGKNAWPSIYTVDSNKVDFIINPTIQITTQPTTQTVPSTSIRGGWLTSAAAATFKVVGIVTGHGAETLSYQWTANGSDLTNGETSYNITVPVDPVNIEVPGFSGDSIYFDATGWSGNRQITFSTTEESGIYHRIKIDGIGMFPENYGTGTIAVLGGWIYQCSTSSDGPANLHIGGDTPAGGGNQRLVIEEGGDDWNDMILNIRGGGLFRRIPSQPVMSSGPREEVRTLTDLVDGAQTNELKMSTNVAGIQTVNCRITHPVACNSPLYSNTVNLNVITARTIIKYENISGGGDWYGGGEKNIYTEAARWEAPDLALSKMLVVYAPEQDVIAKVTMAAGAGSSNYSWQSDGMKGGEGGVSKFYLTLKQNVEYVFKLGRSEGRANGGSGGCFLYRGGTLLVAIGGGGGAGERFEGGSGGGIGIAGANGNANGASRDWGAGGRTYPTGQLPLQGYFQGGNWLPPRSGNDGGRVSGCTFGQYWTGQGYSACENMGYVKFRTANGGEISQTTNTILRGYKVGLGHRGNNGASNWSGGGGGGAVGGSGATDRNAGGGGGSGYTNGEVEVISTQRGGNTSQDGYLILEAL